MLLFMASTIECWIENGSIGSKCTIGTNRVSDVKGHIRTELRIQKDSTGLNGSIFFNKEMKNSGKVIKRKNAQWTI